MNKLMLTAAALAILAAGTPAFAADPAAPAGPGAEMHKSFKDLTPAEREAKKAEWEKKKEERWAKTDTDKDGSLSKAEFVAEGQRRSEEMFTKLDANNDGKVTKEEMKAGHEKMRAKMKERMEGKKAE